MSISLNKNSSIVPLSKRDTIQMDAEEDICKMVLIMLSRTNSQSNHNIHMLVKTKHAPAQRPQQDTELASGPK